MRRFETGQVLLDDGRDDREDDGRGQRDPEDDPEKCEHDRQERHYHYDDEHPSEWDRPMERSIGPAEGLFVGAAVRSPLLPQLASQLTGHPQEDATVLRPLRQNWVGHVPLWDRSS